MTTKREKFILNFVEVEVEKSYNEIVEYMNTYFTQEMRNEHCENILNMLTKKSVSAEIKIHLLASF